MSFALIICLIISFMINTIETAERRMLKYRSAQEVFDEGIRSYQDKLYFPYHQITTLNNLPMLRYQFRCDALTEINVHHNHLLLSDLIIVLKQVPNLENLDFSYNEVHEIRDIPAHGSLVTIQLNDNHIKRFNIKNFFTSLSRLRICLLHNNPLHADDVVDVKGYYPEVKEAWFDERALAPRTMMTCIKIFPNLQCELMPGSHAVQEHYTKYERHYIHGFDKDELALCGSVGALCGFLGGSIYGFMAVSPWSHPGDRLLSVLIYGTLGAGVGSVLLPSCAILWNRMCCNYYILTTHTRHVHSQPSLLRLHDGVPGQEDRDPI